MPLQRNETKTNTQKITGKSSRPSTTKANQVQRNAQANANNPVLKRDLNQDYKSLQKTIQNNQGILTSINDYLNGSKYDKNTNGAYLKQIERISAGLGGHTGVKEYDSARDQYDKYLGQLKTALQSRQTNYDEIGEENYNKLWDASQVKNIGQYEQYVSDLQKQADEAKKNRSQAWWQNAGNILTNAWNVASGNTFMPADTNIVDGANLAAKTKADAKKADEEYRYAQDVLNIAKEAELNRKYAALPNYKAVEREQAKYSPDSYEYQWLGNLAKSKKTAGDYRNEADEVQKQIDELKRTNYYGVVGQEFNSQTGETYDRTGWVNDGKIKQLENQKQDLEGWENALVKKQEYTNKTKLSDFKSLSEVPGDAYLGAFSGDVLYSYINGDNFGSQEARSIGKFTNKQLNKLTDEEKQIYNYIHNTEGKEAANEYLEYLKYDLNARVANETQEENVRFANEHPALASAASVPTSLASGAGIIDAAYQNIRRDITGEPTRIDYNTGAQQLVKATTDIRGTVAKNITDATGVIDIDPKEHPIFAQILNGKSLGDVYQLGMSTVDSMAAAAIGNITGIGATSSILLGGSAGSQGVLEALDKGATDEQALWMGLFNGAFETLFEYVSLDKLLHSSGNVVADMLTQMFTEGSEEVNTSIANAIAEGVILNENSDFRKEIRRLMDEELKGITNPSEEQIAEAEKKATQQAWKDLGTGLLWDFIGGAAMGGVSSVAWNSLGNASKALTDNREYKGNASEIVNTGDALRAMQESAGLNDSAETADNVLEYLSGKKTADTADTLANTVDALRSKIEAGEKVTNKDVRTAQEQIEKAKRQVVENAIKESLSGTGNEQRASQIADAIFERKGISARKGTAWIGQNEGLNKAYRAGMNSYADMLELAEKAADIAKKNEEAVKSDNAENVYDAERRAKALRLGADTLRATKSLDRNAPIASNGDKLSNVTGIKVEGDTVSATLSNGETVNLDDLDIVERPNTSNEASFGYQIKRLVKSYGEASQAVYQGFLNSDMTLSAYLDVADRITTIAKSSSLGYAEGIKALRNSKLVQGLSNLQQEHLWSIGKGLVVKQKAATKKSSYRDVDVSTEDIEIGGEKFKGASDMEAGYKDLATKISKASKGNLSFHFYHGGEGNNTNGFYQSGVVYINVDAVRDGKSLVSYTMSHELTHFIQEYNADAYKKLKDFVVKKLTKKKGKTLNALVLEKQARDKGISYEDALDEVVADGCEMMLQNSNILEELAVQDQSLAQTVISHAKAFLKRVTSGLNPIHDEAKELMKYADQLQKMWDKALAEAITSEQENRNTRSKEDGKQYSIKETADGRPVLVVNDDLTRYADNDNDLLRIAKKAIRHFRRIPIHNQTIFFAERSGGEFTRSGDTKTLRKKYKQIFYDKMSAGAHPVEIIYATTDYINEEKKHERDDDIVDFARGKILVDASGRQYTGDVIIAFTKKGICRFHDIVNLTPTSFKYKELAIPTTAIESKDSSGNGIANSSKDNISQTTGESKLQKSVSDIGEADTVVYDEDGEVAVYTDEDENIQFSRASWDEIGRDKLYDFLDKQIEAGELNKSEAKKIKKEMETLYGILKEFEDSDEFTTYSQWSKATIKTDDNGMPILSVITPNGEYKMNIDYSLVCKKRRTLDAVYNKLVELGAADDVFANTKDASSKQIVTINNLIRREGFETACALCFVDAKRFRVINVADQFVNIWNRTVNSLSKDPIAYHNFGGDKTLPDIKNGIDTYDDSQLDFSYIEKVLAKEANRESHTVPYKVAQYIKENPSERKLLSRGDFISSNGFGTVQLASPGILKLYNQKKGSGGPKASFFDKVYANDIIDSSAFKAEAAYEVGGVRLQSFSDYVAHLVFDYLQAFSELSAKKLPAHAYTKEALFALQFGKTGMKINMSLVPNVKANGVAAGLDADGNYAWAGESFANEWVRDNEKFLTELGYGDIYYDENGKRRKMSNLGFELAKKIQRAKGYTDNVGTIAVGVSDEHIRKMLRDPDIRMVIPYHKSGLNPVVAKMNNISAFTDYTNIQNTREYKDGKWTKVKTEPFSWNKWLHENPGKTAKDAAEEYKRICKEKGLKPRFDQFAEEDGYYKLLEDFTEYNEQGEYVAQGAVQMNFPTADDAFGDMKSLVKLGLTEDESLNKRQNDKVEKIAKEIMSVSETKEWIKGEYDFGEKARYSKQDTEFLKNEENNGIRFSMQDPVEETQKLVAVHNKSVNGLRRMLARNGVPFPSIAIKKAGSSHEGFGDVSIVFPRSTIDPKANRDNRLYSNDAWTPTEPRVEYDVGDAYQYNKAVRGEIGDDIFYGLRGSGYLESSELENRLGRESGDVAEALKDISVLKYAYLKSIGQEPRIPAKAQTLYPSGKYKNDYVMEVFDEMGRNAMDDIENGGDEERAKIQNILAQKYEQEMTARLKNADKSKMLNMLKNNNPYRDQYIPLHEFQRAWNTYKNNGYLIKLVDDYGKLDDNLRANRDIEKDKGYRKWLEDKFSDLIKDTGIPNGKGIYTDSGNRRSFKQRHIPATMANIVSQMKKEQERGIGVAGINLRGAATKTYSDVEEMRKDSGRLLGAHVFDEEYDSYMSNFMSRLNEISEKAVIKNQSSSRVRDWEVLNSTQEILLEAVRDAKTKAEMDRKLQREAKWINYSADLTEELWQLKQDVQNMPAPYFEAKPRRVVYPDEALAYILPDNAGDDLIKELTDRGYNVLTYKNGDEADRLEKLNSVEDARFSRADITDDELTEALADEDYERAERVANNDAALSRKALKHDLMNRFSIPEGLRDKLGKKIDSFADDILRDGVVNENTKEDLYNDLYDAGIIKMPAEETAILAAEQMKGSRLYVPEAVKAEFSGDYNRIRSKLMGYKVYLTSDAKDLGVDTLNAEMAEQFPHLFDATNSDEKEILENILDIFENQAKDKEYTLDDYAEMMRKTEGLDIESQQESLERGFDYAVQAFSEKAELEFTLRNRLAGKLTKEGEAKLQQRIKDLKSQRKDLKQAEEDLEKKVRAVQRERDRAQEQVLFYRNQLSVNKNFKKAKPEDVNRFTRNLLESDLWWPVRTQARDIYADMNAIASNLMNGKTDIYDAAYNIAAKCINSAIDVYGKDGRQDDYISALTSEIISGLFDADVRQEYTYAERMQNRLERAKADNKELKAKYQALKKQQAERRKASKYKQQILKLYDTANKMITSPKKSITGHAAMDLMRAVAEMCQYIGTAQDKFYTNKYEALDKLIDEKGSTETRVNRERHLKKTIQQLSELQFRYNQVKNDPMYNYEYDESVNEMLNTLKDTLSGNTLDDLESDKLREIYDAMSALMKTVTEANKLTALNTEKTVLEFAKEAGADIDKAQAIKNETLRDYMNKQKSPDVMFNYFGGYKKGSSFNKMQQMFVDSMRRYLEVKKQFQEIFDESITNNKEFKQMMYEPTKHLVDWGLKDQDGNAVATSRGMMLAAYKLLLQEDSFNAIAKAGFQIPKIEAFYKDDMARAFGGGDDAKFYSQNRAQDLYAIVDRLQELDTQEEDLKADKANISSEEYNKQLNSIESQKRQQLRRWGNIFEEECEKLEELKSNIEDQLTDFEKEFLAKADQWYTHSDDLRNEVNLALYGFVKPGVKNYTPIHRDLAEVQMDIRTDNTDAPANLENAGFNKERVKARAPIQLTDINFDLLHSSEGIARFYGFTEAQRTFNKIYNAKVLGSGKDRNGQDITVKSKIGNKFGTGNRKWLVTGNQYIENYIRSIAGSNFSRENKFGKVYGHVARANLTLNLRVAVSQLASIPTAAAVLGWDNVLRGMGQGIGYAFSTKQKDQLAEKSIYFWQRYKGDGGMPEYSDASRGAGAIDRLYNRLQNTKVGHALLDWCKIMDCAATSMMYPMAEAYVNQHFGDLEGEAREAKIIEIYEETLRKSQPNYTETERSDLLRDKTMAMKIFTMFKTQSNQNLNLLINANGELRRVIRDKANGNATQAEVQEAKRNFANSFTAVVLGGSLAFAVLRMMSNFILGTLSGYRDDDDELTEESVLKGLGKEVLSSLAGNFMGGSLVFDFVWARVNHENYYGISDNAMGAISDLVDSAFKLQVAPDEGSEEPWAKVISSWSKFALEVCDFAGIPISNAKKIEEAGEMWANDLKNGTFGKFEGNVERTDAQNYNIIIKRFLNEDYAGSQEMYDSMFTSWGEKQDVEAGMKRSIKDKFIDGHITEDDAMSLLLSYVMDDENDAADLITEWHGVIDTGYTYNDIQEAYMEGSATANDLRNYMSTYKFMEKDAIDKKINELDFETENGFAPSKLKDAYVEGEITAQEAARYYHEVYGKDLDDAKVRVSEWQAYKDTGIEYSEIEDAYYDGKITYNQVVNMLKKYGDKSNSEYSNDEQAVRYADKWRFNKENPKYAGELDVNQVSRWYSEYKGKVKIDKFMMYLDFIGNGYHGAAPSQTEILEWMPSHLTYEEALALWTYKGWSTSNKNMKKLTNAYGK